MSSTSSTNTQVTQASEPETSMDKTTILIPTGCLLLQKSSSSFVPWDNPDNIISNAMQPRAHVVINMYILTILFCISVPCNALNMLVFWKQGLRERINLCLFYLAFADLVNVSIYFFIYMDDMTAEFRPGAPSPGWLKFIVNNYVSVLVGFSQVSWFMCTVIAIERCICVVFPLRSQSLISTRAMLVIIVVATVLIVGFHFPFAMRIRVACMYNTATRLVKDYVVPSQFALENPEFLEWMEGIIFGVILPGLFLVCVTSATAITIHQLRAVSQWRQLAVSGGGSNTATSGVTAKSGATSSSSVTTSVGSLSARELALTRMLIVISVVFIILTTPLIVFRSMFLFFPGLKIGEKHHNLHTLFVRICSLCFYLNSTVNFFVYCTTGSRFRATLRGFFSRCGIVSRRACNAATTVSKLSTSGSILVSVQPQP